MGEALDEGRGRSVVQCSPIEAPLWAGVSLGIIEDGAADEAALASLSGALVAKSSSAMVLIFSSLLILC